MDSKQHEATRERLRTLGLALTIGGGVLTAIGLTSFFSAFNSYGSPDYFWCAFLGMPLLGVGGSILRAGYAGAVSRYMAGEVAPVAKDTINYLGEGSRETIATVAQAIGKGLAGDRGEEAQPQKVLVRCHKCNYENGGGAKYCNNCGAALLKSKPCPKCGELNDPDARFCDNCGNSF